MNKSVTSNEQVINMSSTTDELVMSKGWTTNEHASCEQVMNKSWTSHEHVMKKLLSSWDHSYTTWAVLVHN